MAFEYLAQYTTFESIADMDKSVEDHIAVHYYDLTESERAIVFKLASHALEYPGACHLKAATIAVALEISTKTVYRAISKLESLGIIKKETTVKSKGGQGASIYIILPYNVSPSMSDRQNAEKPCESSVCPPQSQELPSSSFNLLTSNLQEVYESAHAEKEAHKEYMNKYQVMLFDFMHSLPLADNLKDELHKVVLAAQVQNASDFIRAKNVIFKIAMDIKEGVLTVTSTLRAVFVGVYSKAVERSSVKPNKSSTVEGKVKRERPVPFYNWLNERDGLSQSIVHDEPSIDNWLEW
ncbi:helix-turn-helix domain-containing protein [Lysinibacillus pakistanensis]|uniref:Helix-turn-helix domain-containing protein n=1 Tax=Lysinibacillus pakistanensis TaxID=759811 RepID=A0AAX3WZG1_9BACI|nr:helix-turn-helix domain-containing protein [Lysinibacillus pakistanensis]MDM5231503.1 helix-turn-helix domain-containing protein [Lysinibacillus pakistanensis]WHY47050.1 helix-turn-helix domain-containing protein [Lysinibacillus pakistanensis]WHY52061.1 helix-turn-helix domain-containing protein [Lysinibacillus pakistanensis]